MTDWFSTAIGLQRDLLRAQRAQMDAARKMLDAGQQVAAMQEAGQRAAEANLQAWRQWSQFWGWK